MDDYEAQADIDIISQIPQTQEGESHNFTKQLAAYFGAAVSGALTSDGLPTRMYDDTYHSGLVRKLPLYPYVQLNRNLYKNFTSGLGQKTFAIAQNKYTAGVDEVMIQALRTNVMNVNWKTLAPLLQALASQAESMRITSASSGQDLVNELLVSTKSTLSQDFVIPHILPIEQIGLDSDVEARYTLESLREAATSRIFDTSKELLRHVYTAYYSSETYITNDTLIATLADALTPNYIKDSLQNLIDHLSAGDAYYHIYALHRSTAIDDRKSLYVYFGELGYDNSTYPLFYTKVSSSHTFPTMTLLFEDVVHVNKPAIEYVLRRFGVQMGQTIPTNLDIPDELYASGDINSLQQLVSTLCDRLKLPNDIRLSKPALQESTNRLATITNRVFLYADKSHDSAISNDYVAIQAGGTAHKKTEKYIAELLLKPQARVVDEINEAWDASSLSQKISPLLPLALNDEQRKVLTAFDKQGSERIVIDAPANTGKQHLINASILSMLMNNKRVLVVSNSTESAKHLRNEIGNILHTTSGYRGHNPVLDLQHPEQLEYIDEQMMADLTVAVQTVEDKASELSAAKKRKIRALNENLDRFVMGAENINLHDVEQNSYNERRFVGKDWIEDEPIEEIGENIQRLHRALQYVRSSEAGYLMPFMETEKQHSIEDFLAAYTEYENASKNVHARLPGFVLRFKKLLPDQQGHLRESLAYIQSNYRQFVRIIHESPASNWLSLDEQSSYKDIAEQEKLFDTIISVAHGANRFFRYSDRARLLHELDMYKAEPREITEAFDTYVEQIATLKSKLFGFSGRMLVVENLNKQLIKSLPSFGLPEPEKQTESMQVMSDFVRYATHELAAAGLKPQLWKYVVQVMLAGDDKVDEVHQILNGLNQAGKYDFLHDFKIHDADNLLANVTLLEYATELNRVYKEYPKVGKLFGVTTINHLLARPQEYASRAKKLTRDLSEAAQLNEAKSSINGFIDAHPAASKRLGIQLANGNLDIVDDTFANCDSEVINDYVAHKKKEQAIRKGFNDVATDSSADDYLEYQQILGTELQYLLNKKLLAAEKNGGVDTIKDALRNQHELTTAQLTALLEVFPVVASEVHELSNTIPFAPDTFDLIIIDTADSLSIAEAFPAALRGKKVLAIGDSAQATISLNINNSALNDLHTNQLTTALRGELTKESADSKNAIITKQKSTFIASVSALNFFSEYANYSASFKKQYGVYGELASFGNKYYYDSKPINLTSRATPVAELFAFSRVKPKAKSVTRFTNSTEADHIIKHLHTLKEQGFTGTIGIVTPFAEQAALIQQEIDECVITDWFERRQLRVMTFDTRRGHERDYTFYSLVASQEFNELSQKLPATIGFDAFSYDTRSHRLLTGFSGNNHSIHIVHSLPFDAYGGSLSEALNHFNNQLKGSSVTVKGGATDIRMPTEATIVKAFEKTAFAKRYADRITFTAKYPLANYMKPLSPEYHKASYKAFFLVMLDDRPLVIEYDDFKERFMQNNKSESGNGAYLSADDIYAYKLLEGYGYRFLRLNKFTLGNDPVRTLDEHLSSISRMPTWAADNGFIA